MLSPIKALRGFLKRRQRRTNPHARRQTRLAVETLEHRRVLAASGVLPGIMGTVYTDMNANGLIDAGEGVQGATVRLFQDDGDGVFEPGTDDVQVGADLLTDANGEYCFDNLDQDLTYFVQQPAQLVGGNNLVAQASPLIEIEPDLIIDSFNTTQETSAEPPPVSNDESALVFPNENEVLGAERDLAVELSAGVSEVQLRVNPFGLSDVLLFDSSAGTQGSREITWDGIDGDGDGLAFGLNGRDLTQNGTLSGITMRMGVDANGADARLRLYQGNAGTFSEVTVPMPVTGGAATEWVFIPFSDFAGPVDEANVDAIQLILDTGNDSVDGQIDVIGVLGAEVSNFANDVLIDLELVKSVDAVEVNNGDTVTWTLTLTNNEDNANSSASGVVVADTLPVGVTFVSANTTNGTFNNGTWTLADPIAPDEVATLTLVTTVNSSIAGGSVLQNVAQVTAHDQPDFDSTPNDDDGDQSDDDEDNAQVTVGEFIDLEVTKVSDTALADAGDQVTFTVTITNNANNANADATGVLVADAIPTGLTLVSATPSGNGTFVNGIWSLVDPLSPGATQTLSIVTTVDASVQGDTQITNVAQVQAANETDADSIPNNDDGDQSEDDESSAMLTVGAVIDLELDKSVDATDVNPGDTVVWTINVTNNQANANAAATNVQVTDVLPTGVTLVSDTPSGNGTFANGVWSLVDPLQPGAIATLTLTSTVNAGLNGGSQLSNTAQVTAADQQDIDSTPNNDDGDQSEDDEDLASVQLSSQIDLELQKTVSATNVAIDDQVTWTVTVTNSATNANTDATGVQVTDVLPAGVTFDSASPSVGTFAGNTWTLGSPLAPGATATLGIVTTVNSSNNGGDVLTNTAQVSAANETDIDSAPGNDDGDQSEDDEDSAQITVSAVIDVNINKTVDQTNVAVGDTVTWTITVENDADRANTPATGVTVEDVLPTGVTFVSSTATNGTYDNATGIWTLAAPLNPGDSAILTVVSNVSGAVAGSTLINVAQVASHNETDVDSLPGNDDGDQSEDDEDPESVNVGLVRPLSKRALLASS